MVVQLPRVLAIEPTFGREVHGLGEDGWVALHHPRRHADDCAAGREVAIERCAGVRDDAGQASWDAEREAKSFLDTAGLEVREAR